LAIDMHAHWSPRGLAAASAAGRDWYGWRILRDPGGREYVSLGERTLPFSLSASLLDDPLARHQKRAGEGVDFESLLLTGLYWNYHLDEERAARFAREVNEELAEVERAYPDCFQGVAVLPMQHPKVALAELDHAVQNLGFKVVALASNVRGLNLDEPSVLQVLEAAAAMNVSIIVHPVIWDKAGEERMPRYHFWNSFGAPLESSLAAMSVVYSGLPDRHPDLRIMFTQGGGWIHFGVGRLNLRYQQRPDARPMQHPPASYLGRMYFDCLVHDEDSLALLTKRAGTDHVMVGTDYPASGNIMGGAVKWIEQCTLFTPDQKEQMLWRNAARFLRMTDAHPYLRRSKGHRSHL